MSLIKVVDPRNQKKETSKPITNQKRIRDLSFTKTDRRVLLKTLEKFYETKLWNINFNIAQHNLPSTLTRTEAWERRHRMELKAIETVLFLLGSAYMANVDALNHRQTTNLNASNNGLLQDIKQAFDSKNRNRKR